MLLYLPSGAQTFAHNYMSDICVSYPCPRKASNQSFDLISESYDSNTNLFPVAIGFAWACKKTLQLQWLQMHCSYTCARRHTQTQHWWKHVTELSVVCLYSNDISGIAGDVNTIYLCKRTMSALCQRAKFYWLIKFYPAYSSANWSYCLCFKNAQEPSLKVFPVGNVYMLVDLFRLNRYYKKNTI